MKVKTTIGSRSKLKPVLIIVVSLLMSIFMGVSAIADSAMEAAQLVEKSRMTMQNFMAAPEMNAFRNLLRSARGVFISPQVLKGAFVIGFAGGSGVFLAFDSRTGSWSYPAFYTVGEASFGFQVGGKASEVILLAMTDRGTNAFLSNSLKLGADAGVAAGPVGVGASAATANLSADILSFARSKGLYGGISLDGAVISTRNGWNQGYYGKVVTPADILVLRNVSNPQASELMRLVTQGALGQ